MTGVSHYATISALYPVEWNHSLDADKGKISHIASFPSGAGAGGQKEPQTRYRTRFLFFTKENAYIYIYIYLSH